MQVLRWVAEEELSGHIETYSADYAASQYMDIATDEEIDLFLKSTPLYDNDAREWTHLVDLEAECDIYARIHHIIQTVVSSLGRVSSEEGVSREVVATNYRRLAHVEQRDMGDASTPAIVVKATGPSFEDPVHDEQGDATPLGYTNIASCFHVRLEELLYDEDVYYAQESGIFARYFHSPTCPSCYELTHSLQADVDSTAESTICPQSHDQRGGLLFVPLRSIRRSVHTTFQHPPVPKGVHSPGPWPQFPRRGGSWP